MRIGVNALYLIPGKVGGTEIYLRNLLSALATIDRTNEYIVFTNVETGADLIPSAPNFTRVPQPVRATLRPARILWEQVLLPLAVRKHKIDVLFNPGFTSPILSFRPNVTVFHDLQHIRHPQHFRWYDLPFWRLLLWASVRRSTRLIAVSASTRDDLRGHYGTDATVIHHGVEKDFFDLASRREPQRYLLCVSTLHPHKNLDRLIRAFDVPDMQLVIAGLRGFHAEQLDRLISERGLAGRVRLTGWIPRQELYELYRRAWAFVYPSTFEGFGMPVLEAMASGVRVACSRIRPLLEIAADTVIYFDPLNEDELRQTLRLLSSGTPEATSAAQTRAKEFTWEQAARKTLDYLSKSSN